MRGCYIYGRPPQSHSGSDGHLTVFNESSEGFPFWHRTVRCYQKFGGADTVFSSSVSTHGRNTQNADVTGTRCAGGGSLFLRLAPAAHVNERVVYPYSVGSEPRAFFWWYTDSGLLVLPSAIWSIAQPAFSRACLRSKV